MGLSHSFSLQTGCLSLESPGEGPFPESKPCKLGKEPEIGANEGKLSLDHMISRASRSEVWDQGQEQQELEQKQKELTALRLFFFLQLPEREELQT